MFRLSLRLFRRLSAYPLVFALFICGLSVCALAACGGAPVVTTEVPPTVVAIAPPLAPVSGLELMPTETFFAARADMDQLRDSPYYETIATWIGQAEEAFFADQPRSNPVSVRELLNRVHMAHFGVAPGDPKPSAFLVVRGDFEDGEFETWIREAAALEGTPVTDRRVGDHQVFAGAELEGAAIGDFWFLATAGDLEGMLARYDGARGETALSRPEFARMAHEMEFETAAASAVMEATPEFQAMVQREGNSRAGAFFESLVSAGGRLHVSTGIDALAVGHMNNAQAANELAAEGQSGLTELRSEPMIGMMGFGPVLDSLEVRTEGTDAIGTFRMDEDTARSTLQRVGGLVGLTIQSIVSDMAPGQ